MFFLLLLDVDFYDSVLHLRADFELDKMGQRQSNTATSFEKKENKSKTQAGTATTSSENGLFILWNAWEGHTPRVAMKTIKNKKVDWIGSCNMNNKCTLL